jgi:S1-C subfamily serine protease
LISEISGDDMAYRRNWTPFIVVAVLLLNVVVVAYLAITFTTEFTDLKTEFITLQTQATDLQSQLSGLRDQIQIVKYANVTEYLPLPAIFDAVKNSVVLIETDVGQGSGFVYSASGYIITNNHVVEDATTIRVTFISGNMSRASIVGRDPYSDIAVVQVTDVSTAELHPIYLGNSSALVVGEPVVAIGNPFGLSQTITLGIISQVGRELATTGNFRIVDVIQLDAAINPGNSGGPLVNMRGEVVGVNTAIIEGAEGLGFAIPSDTVRRELPELIATGSYKHPWLGISGLSLDVDIAEEMNLNVTRGVLIAEVTAGGPAATAGLHEGSYMKIINGVQVVLGGDVIIGINDIAVRDFNELVVYMERKTTPGQTVDLTILRSQSVPPPLRKMVVALTLGERPPS